MQPQHCCRIDLGELQALITKKLGPNKSKQYFHYLNRFLNQKLSKSEFNKLCIRVLGRENIELHNQFIQSILKNVSQAKTPPPISRSCFSISYANAANTSVREEGFEQRGGVHPNDNETAPVWSNGFVPPPSRKSRLMNLKDNEKVDYASQAITGAENGTIMPCDYQRPLQSLQSVCSDLPENKFGVAALRSEEKRRINNESEATLVEDSLNSFQRPLLAPLGIPAWSAGIGGPCKFMPMFNTIDFPSYFDSGGLYDSRTLRQRMEQIAISEGLVGVSAECGNVLNNVMDMYLKRLIRSCVELAGARSTCQSRRNPMNKQQMQGKSINGIWLNNHLHVQNGSEHADVMLEQKPQYSISLLDFKVAMELNPKQLGGEWPIRLEKICMHPFDQ